MTSDERRDRLMARPKPLESAMELFLMPSTGLPCPLGHCFCKLSAARAVWTRQRDDELRRAAGSGNFSGVPAPPSSGLDPEPIRIRRE